MDIVTITKYSIIMFIKGLIVALFTLVSTYIIHLTFISFNFEYYKPVIFIESTSGIVYFYIITTIIAIFIGELFSILKQRFKERLITIFCYYFFFNHLLIISDIFFNNPVLVLFYEFTYHLIPSIVFTIIVAILWKPKGELTSIFDKLKDYLNFRSLKNWLIRFIIGWLSFVPVFYVTHWLISPFTEPYYQEIGVELINFATFSATAILLLLIGFLFVTVLMPIFILWQRSKPSLLFWIGFPIFIQGGIYSLFVESWLPYGIRFPYLIQFTVVAYLMAIIYVQLFYVPDEDEIIDDQFKWLY